jgi:RNA polymerase sigma factor (TIGR02999 family)
VGPTHSNDTPRLADDLRTNALFSSLYSELHRLAKSELWRNGSVTLSVTTLLHEAYLNMSRREGAAFPDHARFMGYAARVMRGIIIDRVRSRDAQKRGGDFNITSLDGDALAGSADIRKLSMISDSLNELASVEPGLAEIVDLKFFCGFSFAEIAAMYKLSERSVQRRWEKARIYLYQSIRANSSH